MKKFNSTKRLFIGVVTGVLLFIPIYTFYSCNNSNATKPPEVKNVISSPSQVEQLESMGFSRSASVITLKSNVEKDRLAKKGFAYMSEEEMQLFMAENNFFKGPANIYIGNIPQDAAQKIIDTYKSFSACEPVLYIDPHGVKHDQANYDATDESAQRWVAMGRIINKRIFVVGPFYKFDQRDMVLFGRDLKPKSTDPIAVVETETGYVELARW